MTKVINMQHTHTHTHTYENASRTCSSVGSDSTYSRHSTAVAADRCKIELYCSKLDMQWLYFKERGGKQEKESLSIGLQPRLGSSLKDSWDKVLWLSITFN